MHLYREIESAEGVVEPEYIVTGQRMRDYCEKKQDITESHGHQKLICTKSGVRACVIKLTDYATRIVAFPH